MKLWEAILIGCDRRAQAFGALFQREADETLTSCALGAAFEARFNDTPDLGSPHLKLTRAFPILGRTIDHCPLSCGEADDRDSNVYKMIVHLNDGHWWPRERIAMEFVKPIEEGADE